MTTEDLQLDAFSARLDAYGANLERWPAAEADEARRLMARSPEARARHDEAERLDALVAEAARTETPHGFAFRLVAEIAARRQDRWGLLLFGSPGRFGLASATFCAAALAIGIALGAAVGPRSASVGALDLGAAVELSLSDGDL